MVYILSRRLLFMRPSSLGGGRILRRTLSVCPSVSLSVCPSVLLSLPSVTSFRQPLASRMYFSARTEGRISYVHLGRTNSCFLVIFTLSAIARRKLKCLTLGWTVIAVQISTDFNFVFFLLTCFVWSHTYRRMFSIITFLNKFV